jgi:hypothetical protein
MVTAETAVVLPVLLLVLAAAVGALVIVGSQLRCVDAAREAVRAATRGDAVPQVRRLAEQAAPPGSSVSLATGNGSVSVTVTAPVHPLGPLPLVVRVTAAATGQLEPGAAGAAP